MTEAKRFLRQVSDQAYNSETNAGAVAVGTAVPAGKRRVIYRVIISNSSTTLADVTLHTDGATAAAGTIIDRLNVLSNAVPRGIQTRGRNINTPVYILTTGQQLGLRINTGATTIHITILFYDDVA